MGVTVTVAVTPLPSIQTVGVTLAPVGWTPGQVMTTVEGSAEGPQESQVTVLTTNPAGTGGGTQLAGLPVQSWLTV